MRYINADRPEFWQLGDQPEPEKGAYLCPTGVMIEQRLILKADEAEPNAD